MKVKFSSTVIQQLALTVGLLVFIPLGLDAYIRYQLKKATFYPDLLSTSVVHHSRNNQLKEPSAETNGISAPSKLTGSSSIYRLHQERDVVGIGIRTDLKQDGNLTDVLHQPFGGEASYNVALTAQDYEAFELDSNLNSSLNMHDSEMYFGASKRFLETTSQNKRIYGSSGTGAIYWLPGLLQIDYPFACKCDPSALQNFQPDNSDTTPTVSTIKCAATGSSTGIFSKDAMCDATNGGTRLCSHMAFLVILIGFLFLDAPSFY